MEKTILRTEDLTRYFGGLAALHHVSIRIMENEVLGIIGPNGAGKTTLINVIAGIYLPTQGRIFFNERDITASPAHQRCRLGIGRTFQLAQPLENLNLLENIMLGPLFGQGSSQRRARVEALEICDFVGLSDTERDLLRLTALEVKKMEIARALGAQPKIFFFDEVMAGLNVEETKEMMGLVRKIHARGVSIVIIEHVMQIIKELTHRVIVLDWGQILAEGPYEEIANDPQVIRAYLGEEA